MMIQIHKAKRPNYSDIESEEGVFSHLCRTCWEPVYQPFIKGLWYHSDAWKQRQTNCKNLIPTSYSRIDRDKQYTCSHDFRFHKDLEGALKCVKCGFPQRIDLLDQHRWISNYYCFDCKKHFKNLAQHYSKTHKGKAFEFKHIRAKPENEVAQ